MFKPITKPLLSIMACCVACVVLPSCGTKGPLYIPEQRYPQKVEGQKENSQKPNTEAPSATKP